MLSGPRADDDARARAADESVSARAARRAAVSSKFQAPRGTHDVLPADAAWWHVVRTMEEVTGLYGWGRIQTPGFEDTRLFARTSGAASDVVHKEMYNFTDRSDRPLTLRPEGTAPIARAYVEHGLHREPQPVKAYTIAPMYRYGAPGLGRFREHYQLSVEAIGSADPAIDAEVILLYARAPRPARRDEVGAAAELDRRRGLPPAVRREAERVARRARRRARRRRPPQARDEPSAGVRREGRARACRARRRAEDRRVALRRVPCAFRRRAVTARLRSA